MSNGNLAPPRDAEIAQLRTALAARDAEIERLKETLDAARLEAGEVINDVRTQLYAALDAGNRLKKDAERWAWARDNGCVWAPGPFYIESIGDIALGVGERTAGRVGGRYADAAIDAAMKGE